MTEHREVGWQHADPKWRFGITHDRYLAAEYINRPHEDFPGKVRLTQSVIGQSVESYDNYTALIRNGRIGFRINPMTLWVAHCIVFPEAKNNWYRQTPVVIDHVAIPWETIPHNIDRISGEFYTDSELREWYIAFQRIHPFEDGNGRIGGIMLAAGSFVLNGYYTYHIQPDWSDNQDGAHHPGK